MAVLFPLRFQKGVSHLLLAHVKQRQTDSAVGLGAASAGNGACVDFVLPKWTQGAQRASRRGPERTLLKVNSSLPNTSQRKPAPSYPSASLLTNQNPCFTREGENQNPPPPPPPPLCSTLKLNFLHNPLPLRQPPSALLHSSFLRIVAQIVSSLLPHFQTPPPPPAC